jgi:23S rRNA (guanosine2251-2'-O)-methyltransferase
MKKLSMSDLNRLSPEEFKASEKLPVVLVLDDVRSAYNVGSIFRTADAFRVEAIYICGISARPPHKDISKTALGATESVHWQYFQDVKEAVGMLKLEQFKVYMIEQADQSIALGDFKPEEGKKLAFIFGHEVFGVKEELIPMVDGCIEIPQFGTKHSFNVAISAGIVLWEVSTKMKIPG